MPDGVHHRGALVGIADRVLPVVGRNEVAAWHPHQMAVHLAHQRNHVGSKPADIVGRHKGHRANPEISLTGPCDL